MSSDVRNSSKYAKIFRKDLLRTKGRTAHRTRSRDIKVFTTVRQHWAERQKGDGLKEDRWPLGEERYVFKTGRNRWIVARGAARNRKCWFEHVTVLCASGANVNDDYDD